MKRKIRNQMVVSCKTNDELKALFSYLNENHYFWKSGNKCSSKDYKSYEDANICFHLNPGNILTCGKKNYFESHQIPVVSFEELSLE